MGQHSSHFGGRTVLTLTSWGNGMTFGGEKVCCEVTNSSKNGSDDDSGISPSFKYVTNNTPASRIFCPSASFPSATLLPALLTPLSSVPSRISGNSNTKNVN